MSCRRRWRRRWNRNPEVAEWRHLVDFSHLKKLLSSKNPKVQIFGGVLAILAWSPVAVEIWEDPSQSIASRLTGIGQSLALQAGGLMLLSIPPENLEDDESDSDSSL